jgi:hypothetical protein
MINKNCAEKKNWKIFGFTNVNSFVNILSILDTQFVVIVIQRWSSSGKQNKIKEVDIYYAIL